MDDWKNREDSGKKPGKDPKQDDFIREKIQEKPKKKKFLKKALFSAGLAVIFGCVSGVTFFLCSGLGGQDGSRENVTIPRDTESVGESGTETAGQSTSAGSESLEESVKGIVENYLSSRESYESEKSRSCVEQVSDLIEKMQPCLVTVTSVTADQDVFEHTYERSEKTFGVILAVTDTDVRILTETGLEGVADSVHITLGNQETFDATYVSSDGTTGFAVVSIPVSSLDEEAVSYIRAAELGNSYSLQDGDMVVALGDPMGYVPSVGWGIISYIDALHQGTDRNFRLIQTDISGDADAGGILINDEGQIVGWLTQRYADTTRQNLLQAVSISDIKSLIEKVSNGGQPAMLGVRIQTMKGNTELPEDTSAAESSGESTEESGTGNAAETAEEFGTGSAAESTEESGTGNAAETTEESGIGNAAETTGSSAKAGNRAVKQLSLRTLSSGQGEESGTMPQSGAADEGSSAETAVESTEESGTGNTEVSTADPGPERNTETTGAPETTEEPESTEDAGAGFSLAPGETPTGLYVTDLVDGGPAYSAGIQNGDVLVKIEDVRLREASDLADALEKFSPGDTVEVTAMRLSRNRYVSQVFEVHLVAR